MGTGGYKQINKALNVSVFEDYLQSQQARLPRLPDVQQLSPRVIRILGQNTGKFTLQGTNTYIIGTGKQRLIIDTGQGIPKWADLVESTLDKGSFSLSMVMLTHWHGDHTGGVPDLIRMYPTLAGHIYKHSPAKDQRSITDEQIFSVEGATVRAVHGPGHSHDHVCFVLEEENAMFTGDNILGHGTSAVEDLATYMRTLNTMKSQHCRIGYPAHGEVIPDLPGKIEAEISTKRRREERCLHALKGISGVTVKELVHRIHGSHLSEIVREKGLEPFMEEVLKKLAQDGKVAFRIRRGIRFWFLVDCHIEG